MNTPVKMMAILLAIVSLITACKHFDESVIQSFTNENKALEQKLAVMKAFKHQVLSDSQTKYIEMVVAIDPQKKTAYEKDRALKLQLTILKEKIEETAILFENNYNGLSEMIQSNASFILDIPDAEMEDKDIQSDWQQNMEECNGLLDGNNELQKQLTRLSEKHNESVKYVLKKYGIADAVKNSINKKNI